MNFGLSLIVLWATGIAIAALVLGKRVRNFSPLEFSAFSLFMGIGFISYQFFILYLLKLKFDLLNIVVIPAITCFVLLLKKFYLSLRGALEARRSNLRMGLLRPFRARNDEFHRIFYDSKSLAEWDHIEKIILLGILFQIGWILYLTLPTPVNSYDALGFYAFKAKIFYFADCIPEGFFKWNETTVSHPDYPLLVPFLMLWVYKFTGFNDVVIMRIMPIICIFFLALFYFQLKKFFDRKYALFSVFFLITAQQIAGYASIINADFVLLAFVTSGFLYLILYMHTLEKAYIVLSAIFFSFSLWVKNEAAVFIIAFFACFAVFLLKADRMVRRDIFKQLLTSIFIALVIAGPWFVYKFLNHVVNSDINSSNMTPERLLENIRSIPVLLNELQKQVFGPKKWNILWIVVMAVSALRYKKLCKNGFFYISLFILISVVGYFFAYMSTTSANLYYIANKTMSRFMIHFAGVAIFLAAFIFWDEPV